VVLSEGNLVAKGSVAEVVRTTGAKTIGEAFSKLSRKAPATDAENPS
jgi:ABC-2 type transport system ATP-binding protein